MNKSILNLLFTKENIIKISVFAVLVLGLIIGTFIWESKKIKLKTIDDYYLIAKKYEDEGNIPKALEIYDNIVRVKTKDYNLHIKLGDLYRKVDEYEKAKIEYFGAMKIKRTKDIYFRIADLYVDMGEYNLAIYTTTQLKDNNKKSILNKKAAVFRKIGEKLSETSLQEGIRYLLKAHKISSITKEKEYKKTCASLSKKYYELGLTFLDDELYNDAQIQFENSLRFKKNDLAKTELAKLYQDSDFRLALKYIESCDEIEDTDLYASLLLQKADYNLKEGRMTDARYYLEKAKQVKLTDKYKKRYENLILTVVSSGLYKNKKNDNLLPIISFKVVNLSKGSISLINAKVEFLIDDKVISTKEFNIVSPKSPLKHLQKTKIFNSRSDKVISVFNNEKSYTANIYLHDFMNKDTTKWNLYRTIHLQKRWKKNR